MDNERGNLGDRLRNFGPEPDKAVWDGLEAQLAAIRKRRPIAFLWFLAGILLLAGFVGLALWPETKYTESESTTTILPKIVLPQTANKKTDDEKSATKHQNDLANQASKATVQGSEQQPLESVEPSKESHGISTIESTKRSIIKQQKTRSYNKKKVAPVLAIYPKSKAFVALNQEANVETFTPKNTKENSTENISEPGKEGLDEQRALVNNLEKTERPFTEIEPFDKVVPQTSIDSTSNKKLMAKADSLKPEIQVTETKPDSSNLQKTKSWKFEGHLSGFYTVIRYWETNRGADTRISIANQNATLANRMAIEIGGSATKSFGKNWALMISTGVGRQTDEANYQTRQRADEYKRSLGSDGQSVVITPLYSAKNESVKTTRTYGLLATGIHYQPNKLFLRASGGMIFTINEQQKGASNSTNNSVLPFAQFSAGLQQTFGKRTWTLGPELRLFARPAFNYQNRSQHTPVMLGLRFGLSF